MDAHIVIIDQVNIQVDGVGDANMMELVSMFAVYAKGYRFQKKFKLGIWDGKIKFMSVTGRSYLKLLPKIVKYLTRVGYNLSYTDRRTKATLTVPQIDANYLADRGVLMDGNPVILGEHQVRGINALTQYQGIFEGGTGAGKTLMTAALCHLYEDNLNFKVMTIVPTSDLIEQTHEELEKFGVDVGKYTGDTKDLSHRHLVTTWQSLKNNKGIISAFQAVIVDECHGVSGDILRDILNTNGSSCKIRIGLTGTIPIEPIDRMAVNITLGDVVEKVEASELIASGWLAKLKLHMCQTVEDLTVEYQEYMREHPITEADLTYRAYKNKAFPDFVSEKKYIQTNPMRLAFIASMISVAENHTLVMVPNVKYGKELAKLIPGSIFFHGKDDKATRKEIYSSYAGIKQVIGITLYKLASTGLNIKRIFNLFMIDAGKSYIEVIQTIGRGLRKGPGKDKVNVYDVYCDLKYASRHGTARKKHYKSKNYPFSYGKVDYTKLHIGST